jgi:hypothetical protein
MVHILVLVAQDQSVSNEDGETSNTTGTLQFVLLGLANADLQTCGSCYPAQLMLQLMLFSMYQEFGSFTRLVLKITSVNTKEILHCQHSSFQSEFHYQDSGQQELHKNFVYY